MCSFDKVSPATLDATETKFMAELMLKLPKSIISNKSVSENRKDQREAPQDQDDFAEHQEKRFRTLRNQSRAQDNRSLGADPKEQGRFL